MKSKTTKTPPKTIYLFDMAEGFVWCDVPEPDYEKRNVWEYKLVRKSHDAEI